MNKVYVKTREDGNDGYSDYFSSPEWRSAIHLSDWAISPEVGPYYGNPEFCVELFGDPMNVFIDVYESYEEYEFFIKEGY